VDLSALDAGSVEGLAATIASADAVVPVGARTQWEVGNPGIGGLEVAAPAGVVRYEPEDLTITVGAGTSFAALDAALAEYGQECALDPRDRTATIGGVVACGLSGIRRLRHGPLRDHVLEVRFLTGDGRLVKGGGQTVKNVTGYDLPRLLVGSFGTLGVLVQLTLRCRPRAEDTRWFRVDAAAEHSTPGLLPGRVDALGRHNYARLARRRTGRRRDPIASVVGGRCTGAPDGVRTAAACRFRRGSSPTSDARSMRWPGRAGAPSSESGRFTSPATTPACSSRRARRRPRTTAGWCEKQGATASTVSVACCRTSS